MKILDNVLFEIFDDRSNEWVVFETVTVGYNGQTITTVNESELIDGIVYVKTSSGYAKRVLHDNILNIKWFPNVNEAVRIASLYSLPLLVSTVVDLNGGELILPPNVNIHFNGTGYFTNGTIVGDNTTITTGLSKIFETSVTLLGTFIADYIAPQHFGAITNSTTTVFTNDCSASIQACINSPLEVFIPVGLYYVASPIYIPKSKLIRLAGKIDESNSSVNQDHARIYTNQNIHLINIQSGGVYISGGALDVIAVGNFTKGVVRYDLNYNIWNGNVDTFIIGDSASLSANENLVGCGYYFDMSNIVETGYATFLTVSGFVKSLPVGVYSDVMPEIAGLFLNSLTFKINMDGCKMFYNIERIGGVSSFEGYLQCRNVLTTTEKAEGIYPVKIKTFDSYINLMLWDVGVRQPEFLTFKIEGFNNTIGYLTEKQYTGIDNPHDLKFSKINNPSYSIISKDRRGVNTVISKLDSETVAFDKRHTVTVKSFKGAGVDFDTDLNETVGSETTDITLTNRTNLFRVEAAPPSIIFTNNADLDNDFVEVVLTPSSGTFNWAAFFLFIYQGSAFKRIQFIDHYTSSPFTTAYNIYPGAVDDDTAKKTYRWHFSPRGSSKTIIRLIGAYNANSEFLLLDFCGVNSQPSVSPYIHIDGNQRIWGPITTEQYRISALHTAPVSANATGVLGEERITSDYIYRCVATNTWKRAALSTW